MDLNKTFRISFTEDSGVRLSSTLSSVATNTGVSFTDDSRVHTEADIGGVSNTVDAELENLIYGVAPTVEVGSVTTGPKASVTNSGTPQNAVLDFVFPISGGSGGGGIAYNIGHGLVLDEDTNTLMVDTAAEVEADNTLPVTSAAVHTQIGNIEVLLATI